MFQGRKRERSHLLVICALLVWLGVAPGYAQVLPLDQKNTLTADWLVAVEGGDQLMPYVAGRNTGHTALHQWLSVAQGQPFSIGFTAPKDLCLYLNNQLIFKADFSAAYTLDITQFSKGIAPIEGKYLLTVWHPRQVPNINSFRNQVRDPERSQQASERLLPVRMRDYANQSAFILFLLVTGLLYGALRTSFPKDFSSLFGVNAYLRTNALDEGVLVKPVSSLPSLLFILAFSLTLALLITAIHTNVQQIQLFNQLFPVSEADITTKILFYTLLIFMVIVLKYLFLKIMGFIFGLEEVVQLQYREFIRSILFLGISLPLVVLLYLALNTAMPDTILLVSNLAVSIVLIVTIMRVFATVNKKASVLNLHLFSYLCATEVIPLAIMLKLIVFNF
ncbi:DUF4271 domain-containing protein [Pontibacter sp. E15-1]|uniref:DUF4271 domain-containing protein n=1 Tax=Pontibacter sp. E15-1 TaxID=2919918 RepID=UPI001F4F5570|nr:DUF4271 domain-containing protein [Pontibacter sp. E15-1]MCJ8166147.1 DUF4271 domain-containing protein [Pontibacter sp. E15-1]